MFRTNEAWEAENLAHVTTAVFGMPGVRHFRRVHVPLNLPLIHIDVAVPTVDGFDWSRFIFNDFCDSLELFEAGGDRVIRMSVQTRRTEHSDYEIVRISQVFSAEADNGERRYLLVGVNDEHFYDLTWEPSEEKTYEYGIFWRCPSTLG